MVHGYANTKRVQGIIKSGSEKARRIENASILGAFLKVLGLASLLGAESNRTVYEDEHVRVIDDENDGKEESDPVVVDTETEAENVLVPDEGKDTEVSDPVVVKEAQVVDKEVELVRLVEEEVVNSDPEEANTEEAGNAQAVDDTEEA